MRTMTYDIFTMVCGPESSSADTEGGNVCPVFIVTSLIRAEAAKPWKELQKRLILKRPTDPNRIFDFSPMLTPVRC